MPVRIETENGTVVIEADESSTIQGVCINGNEVSVERGRVTLNTFPVMHLPKQRRNATGLWVGLALVSVVVFLSVLFYTLRG